MKKTILLFGILIAFGCNTQSQNVSKNALGLRLGDNDGFGGELSYQRRLSDNNRLELDLGIRDSNYINALKLAALYQWFWKIEGGLNWYAGVGGGVGSWRYERKNDNDNGSFGFVAGDLGIEYDFDFPLQISLDLRPEFYFNSDKYRDNNYGSDIGLGIRYRFQ
jgi:hypothetical protein